MAEPGGKRNLGDAHPAENHGGIDVLPESAGGFQIGGRFSVNENAESRVAVEHSRHVHPFLEGQSRVRRKLLPDSIHSGGEPDMSERIDTQKESNLLVLALIHNRYPVPGVVIQSNPGGNREFIPESRNILRFSPDAGGVAIKFKGVPFYARHTAPEPLKMISAFREQIPQSLV